MRLHGAQVVGGFLDGKVGHQRSVDSGGSGGGAEFLQSELQDGIEIREDDEPGLRLLADLAGDVENSRQIGSVLQGALAGALDDRSVGDGIAEWNAQLNHVGARSDGGERDIARDFEAGIAAGDVDDESGSVGELDGHEEIG